ncbi:hypothetical protein [Maliponia aquimaris]|jgi:hypothetical protein|uniref:Uncharacterized protein n=1 Tax=Maliponia aquimaris TaxID=1673631 RepID=A0A238L5M8_9RHOB|nr:hypothetical protein [Maliponia aquimaris]SMX50413.1 hypothetical protein MAA8898_04770 [Maliponia aquimaris]
MALIEIVPTATRDNARAHDGERSTSLAPLVQLLVGGALVLATFALWLVPAATVSPSLMLFKLGLSVAMLTGGLGLFSGALHRKV